MKPRVNRIKSQAELADDIRWADIEREMERLRDPNDGSFYPTREVVQLFNDLDAQVAFIEAARWIQEASPGLERERRGIRACGVMAVRRALRFYGA